MSNSFKHLFKTLYGDVFESKTCSCSLSQACRQDVTKKERKPQVNSILLPLPGEKDMEGGTKGGKETRKELIRR